jgi:hypothetical protein
MIELVRSTTSVPSGIKKGTSITFELRIIAPRKLRKSCPRTSFSELNVVKFAAARRDFFLHINRRVIVMEIKGQSRMQRLLRVIKAAAAFG